MRNETFRDLMRTLVAVYPMRDQDEQQLKARQQAYWMALRELPDELATDAVNRCIQDCRFMPVPAEILAAATMIAPHWRLRAKAIAAGWVADDEHEEVH